MIVKLADIAKKANVSLSTVSRALNDSSEINEETKEIIRRIAKEMNYVPNISAKALAGKGTKTVLVIVPELRSGYFAQMIYHIESALMRKEYSMIVGMTHHKQEREIDLLNIYSRRKVDGIILIGCLYKGLEPYLHKIKKTNNVPLILMHTTNAFPDHDYIMIDDAQGIYEMIKYLKENGHTEIGFIACKVSSEYRYSAFKEAMRKNGMEYKEKYVKIGTEMFELGGYQMMNELFKEDRLPSAIFAAYDNFALGAMKAIAERNMVVPDDISIVGYDNISESPYFRPGLTTISPPVKEMSEISVRLLIDKIENKNNVIQHIALKPQLIIRDSVKDINTENKNENKD